MPDLDSFHSPVARRSGFPASRWIRGICLLVSLPLMVTFTDGGPCGMGARPAWASTCTLAQLPLAGEQRGNRVAVNGQTLSVDWSVNQGQVYFSTWGVVQALGVELLDTSEATQQPIAWFSDGTLDPRVLPVWLTSTQRYVNITDWANQMGWQIQVNGNVLNLTTHSSATVLGIRQSSQSEGDRIVVDLDHATPWRVEAQGNDWLITLDAAINPAQIALPSRPGRWVQAIQVERSGTQTRLRLRGTSPAMGRAFSLPTPNRIVMDIGSNAVVERDLRWAPGVDWQQRIVAVGSARFPVVMLHLDPRQLHLRIQPIWSDPQRAGGMTPLVTMAQQWGAIAAINGGFFNRDNQLPLGALRQDQRWVSGPILNRGAIAWNDQGEVAIAPLSLQETLTTDRGGRFPLLYLNSGYVQAGLSRYTRDWGSTYAPITNNELLITVQNGQITQHQRAGAAGQSSVPIPTDGYLLAARSYNSVAADLPIGTTVTLEARITPSEFESFPHILGAGPLLLRDRQVVLNAAAEQFSAAFSQQLAVRSAIGVTANGQLLLVTAQPRMGGSSPSLRDMAQIMQQLGTTDALNLDGGSSTTLVLAGQILNRPPSTAARVQNGIGVFLDQPTIP